MIILQISLAAFAGVTLTGWSVMELSKRYDRHSTAWAAISLIIGVIAIAAGTNLALLAAAGLVR